MLPPERFVNLTPYLPLSTFVERGTKRGEVIKKFSLAIDGGDKNPFLLII